MYYSRLYIVAGSCTHLGILLLFFPWYPVYTDICHQNIRARRTRSRPCCWYGMVHHMQRMISYLVYRIIYPLRICSSRHTHRPCPCCRRMRAPRKREYPHRRRQLLHLWRQQSKDVIHSVKFAPV